LTSPAISPPGNSSADAAGAADEPQHAVIIAEWRRSWRTGVATMLGTGLCLSVMPTIASLFVRPLSAEFGWTPGQIGLALNGGLVAALASPFAGRLIDRIGVRKLMLGGMIGMAACYLGLAAMTGPIWVFYALWAAATLLGIATSGLGFSPVLARAFPRSLGFSLAAGRSGLAVTSALLPVTLYAVMTAYSWRAGYALMAFLILAIALPAAWFGIERGTSRRPATATAARTDWRALLLNRKVLLVAVAASLAYTPIIALVSQLQPLLVTKGIAPASAAAMVGLLGAASFVGAVFTGLLLDRFWAPAVAAVMMLGAASGALLILWSGDNPWAVAAGLMLLGLGQGAENDIVAFVIARYFGLQVFSSVYGVTVFAIATGVAVGASLIGLSYDAYRTYDPALWIAAVCLVAAAIIYLALGRYPVEPELRAP
jgi:predicted MFS family arabinose efflux permease